MELLSLIMLVLLIAGLKYDKVNTANKASKYNKSKISMGKMAVDNEKDPHKTDDAEIILFVLGSAYLTAKSAVDKLRSEGKKVGVFSIGVIRPFPVWQIADLCEKAKTILIADRQDSYGAYGGNMSLEIRAALQQKGLATRVISRIYGLGGRDFYEEDAIELFEECYKDDILVSDFFTYG